MCRWFTALLLTVLALHPGPVQAFLRQPSAYVNFTPQEECADGLNEGNLYPQECAEGPYGEDWGRTGTNSIPFGWLGSHGVFHPGNGSLYLTRHRAYDTTLKRFLSSDPIGIAGGGNLYAYCRGNPLALIDPTGKCGYENRIELHMPGVNDLSYQSVGANFHNLTVNDFDIAAGIVGQVSGMNSVEANYAHYGDLGVALNATYNPAYGVLSHGEEAISGYGNSYYNSGQELSTGQRIGSGALSVVDAAATVAVAVGGASMVNSVFSAGTTTGTGFMGREGFELGNASYQPVRNAPGTVGNLDYSGHAFDQMQNRGIMPSVVENTINVGQQFPTRAGTAGYFDPGNNLRVIVNSQNGTVVTVIRGAP